MAELMIDFITSLDGYASGEGWSIGSGSSSSRSSPVGRAANAATTVIRT